VLSAVTDTGQPQSALLGMAVTQQLEIIFDTVKSSRKYPNLKKNPRVAWVLGCTTEVTVQFEGVAEGVSGRRVGQVQKDLFRRISRWTRTGELAGHYLFCCAANLGQILRLQRRRIEERKF
jgi:pyridoxine/pyridoxamine 5'-phosphate oxidase